MTNVDILGFFVVICLSVFPAAYSSIHIFKKYPEKVTPISLNDFVYYLGQILLVSYIVLNQATGLNGIGLVFSQYRFDFLLIGSIASYGLVSIVGGIVKSISGENPRQITFDCSNPAIERTMVHKTFPQRFGYLIVLLIMVIAEEFVFRGYLVLLLGNMTNSVFICALLSITLSVIIHLYQGRAMIVYHLISASVFVGVTILTGNILIPIGAHLYTNILLTVWVWFLSDKSLVAEQKLQANHTQKGVQAIDLSLRIVHILAVMSFFCGYLPYMLLTHF